MIYNMILNIKYSWRILKFASVSIAAFSGMAISNISFSAPTPYPKSGALQIRNPSSAGVLGDTDDQRLIWVQPPNVGLSAFRNFSATANINSCAGVKNLQLGFITTSKIVADMAVKKVELQKEIDAQQSKVDTARREVASLSSTTDMMEIDGMNDRIDILKKQRIEVINRYEDAEDDQLKIELFTQIKDLKNQIKELESKYDILAENNRTDVRALKRAKEILKSEEQILTDIYARMTKFDELILSNMKNIREAMTPYAMLHGGDALLEYDSRWGAIVNELQEINPNYIFRKIPTAHARLYASIPGTANNPNMLASLPAVLDYTISGMKPAAFDNTIDTNLAVPELVSGTFSLSLIGACPVYYQNFTEGTGLVVDRDMQGRPMFGISISYLHPVSYRTDLTARYNMYKFYEQIHKKGKKGGFFSRKNYEEMVQTDIGREDFEITWDIEDPDSKLDFAARSEIEKELKAEIISRALGQYGVPDLSQNAKAMPPAGEAPKTAAQVAADSMGWCRWGLYCRIAVWGLSNLDAFFNNSSSSSFRSTYDRKIEEKFSSTAAIWTPGFIGYKKIYVLKKG